MTPLKLSALIVALGCISWEVDCAAVSADQCLYQNHVYKVGERTNANPCSPCTCYSGGQVMCLAIDCAPPNCVDATRTTGHCCQTCPNGENCKYKDQIIKMGETYKPDAYTTCQCSKDYMHMFGPHGHEAVCLHSAT